MPSHIQRHSGRIMALPAMAASTWSQRWWRWATAASAATGSMAVTAVEPTVATMAQGSMPAARSCWIIGVEGVGAHGVLLVAGDEAEVLAAEAGEEGGFVDGAVALGGDVDGERAGLGLEAAAAEGVVGDALAGGDEGDEGAGGGGVLDDAVEGGGEAGHLTDPVEDDVFDLGDGGAGLPGEAEDAEAGAGEVAEDAGEQAVGGKVAEEARVLPVREAGEDEGVEVGEDVGEGLGLVGRRGGELGGDGAGLDLGHDGTVGEGGAVVGEPVDELMAVGAELFGGHFSLGPERSLVVDRWVQEYLYRLGEGDSKRCGLARCPLMHDRAAGRMIGAPETRR